MIDYEFYETPKSFTEWLFQEVYIAGGVFEPCSGSRAISTCAPTPWRTWFENDLDPRWPADVHKDARDSSLWQAHEFDWVVSNPPFTPAIEIITQAIKYARVGVAMHLRASIHEVLKTGVRRTWMAEHQPTGILWLPRFAYQRSKTTGKWTTDSVCACWVIWIKPRRAVACGYGGEHEHDEAFDAPAPQFIRYAPESVIDALDAETPAYRARMDKLMAERRAA